MFYKTGVLKNLARFSVKHLCQSLFFNKIAGLRPATLLKKRLWHRCFPVKFPKFLRTSPDVSFWLFKRFYFIGIFSSFTALLKYELKVPAYFSSLVITTTQKMKFSIKAFFSECDQIRSFLRIWSHLLRKSLMKTSFFCAVNFTLFHQRNCDYFLVTCSKKKVQLTSKTFHCH